MDTIYIYINSLQKLIGPWRKCEIKTSLNIEILYKLTVASFYHTGKGVIRFLLLTHQPFYVLICDILKELECYMLMFMCICKSIALYCNKTILSQLQVNCGIWHTFRVCTSDHIMLLPSCVTTRRVVQTIPCLP